MGVTDLMKLVKDFPGATKIDGEFPYTHVIIDCSNLITTFIMRHLTTLQYTSQITFDNYVVKMDRSELIAMCIDDQIEMIVRKVVLDAVDLIHKCEAWFPDLKEIILVSDPSKEYDYSYIYNDNIQMSCVDNMMFSKWMALKRIGYEDEYDIRFNAKEEERKIRVKSQEAQRLNPIYVYKDNEVVETFTEYEFPVVEDEELNRIHHILRHCSYFIKRGNAMKLIPHIQQQLVRTFADDDVVKYFCSDTEADVFMKGYYLTHLNHEYALVVSNDTDYSILFGEIPEVDVVKLNPFQPYEIRNPFSYWYSLFDVKGKPLRLLLARLSALLGNDYTCHKRKIVCDPKTVDDWPMLFNCADRSIEEEVTYKNNTSIGKFMRLSQKYYDPDYVHKFRNKAQRYRIANMFKHLDAAVMEDESYFKTYYETLLIYMNAEQYDKYTIMKDTGEDLNIAAKIDEYQIDISILNSPECLISRV